jgi:outer membrane protein TolC
VVNATAQAPGIHAQAAVPPVAPPLAGPQPVEVCIAYALAQNPDIQVARKRVEAAGERVPQAASLEDPTLSVMGYPFYPDVPQTAGGRATARIAATQAIPWFGKLDTRAEMAEAETEMARRELAAAELAVIEQVKRAYYELHYVQKAIRITEDDKKLLIDLSKIAEVKYGTGTVSQQDVLRAQVEVSNLNSELIRLRQQLDSSQARLAQLLHVSPETPLRAAEELPKEQAPHDLEQLYQQAVAARPELQAQLAAIQRDRRSVDLARLAYFPDPALSVEWMGMTTSGALSPLADGVPDVGIGMMVNVPIYRKRLDAGVREAEAKTVASARKYDSLRDQTVQEVKDLFVQATSQYELIRLFRDDIIPKADQTLRVSMSAYEVGRVDFLQLIDNWRQLLRFQITYQRLESQLQQTLASLDRVVGGQLSLEGAEGAKRTPGPRPPTPEEPAPRQPAPGKPQPATP